MRYFNPRTPCGVRPVACGFTAVLTAFQSTHPLRGATVHLLVIADAGFEFQSTHPLRGATDGAPTSAVAGPFQSTHPLRGATTAGRPRRIPRADFNPRTPCGVRQSSRWQDWPVSAYFNPRTPCGVRRHWRLVLHRTLRNFNPRTPCGVRRAALTVAALNKGGFQSTHPLRGATFGVSTPAPGVHISIHAPLAGCDGSILCIYSRREISIHAPLAGCDVTVFSNQPDAVFQSTHPLRGATVITEPYDANVGISIHAPLAGCDETVTYEKARLYISIHAPLAGCDCSPIRAARAYRIQISIHAPLAGCDERNG